MTTLDAPLSTFEPDHADRRAQRSATIAWWVFVLVAAALLPLMIWSSFDFGATWDERDRHRYGQMVLEFLSGARERSTFVEDGGHLYGGLFDTICATLEQWVPLDRYVLRHMVIATFGWAGILFCGRLAARFLGMWSGVLAMTLLVTSPRYFADSMNNPKDLPFTAASVIALYYISTISPKWPYLSWTTAIKIVLALALALNIRAAALIYLGYFGLLVAAFIIIERVTDWRRLARTAAHIAAVVLAVLLLGTLFWPWAQAAPFTRPIEALLALSSFPWTGTHVLFQGYDYDPTKLPWYYAPWWFLISTPPVVLAGALLSVVALGRGWALRSYPLWVMAVFPVLLVIVRHSTLYNGIRHLLFVYPILVLLATLGWTMWLSATRRRWVRRSVAALLALGLANIVFFDVRTHPNETVYFNGLVGGPRGAFDKYEMDYWGNCMLQAVSWSARTARRAGVPIAISGDLLPELVGPDAQRFHELYITPLARGQHQLQLQLMRGTVDDLRNLAGREDALYRVTTADGAVLCVVLPGPKFSTLQSHLARNVPSPRVMP